MPETVTYTAACDQCGIDATWHGERPDSGQATEYRIDCPNCDSEENAA